MTENTSNLLADEEGLSPAQEWEQEASKRALDELFTMTSAYRSSASYADLLRFVARFRFYSPFNAMLVHIQKPGSRFIASPRRWQRDYGRRIKPGGQLLVILQPMGPVMFVFDVSDTEGRPLPEKVENPFEVRGGKIGRQIDKTITNAVRDCIRITQIRLGSQLAGSIGPTGSPGQQLRIDDKNTVPLRYEMTLNENHRPESRYATLVHELAHLYCGHLGTPNDRWWPDRRGLSKEVREFEAESVSYLVCRRVGIEPKSDEYLSGYMEENRQIPSISLECVMKVSGLIEQMGREKLKPRKQS